MHLETFCLTYITNIIGLEKNICLSVRRRAWECFDSSPAWYLLKQKQKTSLPVGATHVQADSGGLGTFKLIFSSCNNRPAVLPRADFSCFARFGHYTLQHFTIASSDLRKESHKIGASSFKACSSPGHAPLPHECWSLKWKNIPHCDITHWIEAKKQNAADDSGPWTFIVSEQAYFVLPRPREWCHSRENKK